MKNASNQNIGRNGFSLIGVMIFATAIGNIVAGGLAFVSTPNSQSGSKVAQISAEIEPEQSAINSLQVETNSEVLAFVQIQTGSSSIEDITFELCDTIDSAGKLELDGEFDWFKTTPSSVDIDAQGENFAFELQAEGATEIASATTDQLYASVTDAPLSISSWW